MNIKKTVGWNERLRNHKPRVIAVMSTLKTIQAIVVVTVVVTILACWLVPMPTVL